MNKIRQQLKSIGPGLLFASSAIGTSHLVLSTRAGAHHGMIFIIVILVSLLIKYPFFAFGARYSAHSGANLLHAYRLQGKWALGIFGFIVIVNMFCVTAAVGAVATGILISVIDIPAVYLSECLAVVLLISLCILIRGGYKMLDIFIKSLSLILFIAVIIAFIAVLGHGPVEAGLGHHPRILFSEPALGLMVSLIGWMPAGMEASVMQSIWVVRSNRGSTMDIKRIMFDFNLGYLFTIFTAVIFLTLGAYTVYGTGQKIEGNAVEFTNRLLEVFISNLGPWSYWVIAIAAFASIYGTLIVIIDAFARCFVETKDLLFDKTGLTDRIKRSSKNKTMILMCLGAFILFHFFAKSMIQMLEFATIIAFVLAPVIAYLNYRSIRMWEKSNTIILTRPERYFSILGLCLLIIFALYYILNLL